MFMKDAVYEIIFKKKTKNDKFCSGKIPRKIIKDFCLSDNLRLYCSQSLKFPEVRVFQSKEKKKK